MTNRTLLNVSLGKKIALTVAGFTALGVPIVIGVMNAPFLRAQAPAATALKFETASIRRCTDEPGVKRGGGYSASARSLKTGCMALAGTDNLGLIQRAYVRFAEGRLHWWPGVVPIMGGPAWTHSELYDIDATGSSDANPEMLQGPMLQALLEDRFQLKLHRETREVPVYALTVAPGGHKLKPFMEGSCTPMPLSMPMPKLAPGQEYCKVRVSSSKPAVDAQGSTLAEFSQLLNLVLDRPVSDQTGISGKFDLHVEFAINETTPRFLPGGDLARFADPASARGASVFTAMEQLGLKLEPAVGSRDFFVIDHVERPSEH